MSRKLIVEPTVQMNARAWDNPYIKWSVYAIGGVFGIVTTTLGCYAAVESRYAKEVDMRAVRGDVLAQSKQVDVATKQLQVQIEYQADRNRKRTLEDSLFKYSMTPDKQRTLTDRALADKYRQEILEMNDRWNKLGMPLK